MCPMFYVPITPRKGDLSLHGCRPIPRSPPQRLRSRPSMDNSGTRTAGTGTISMETLNRREVVAQVVEEVA